MSNDVLIAIINGSFLVVGGVLTTQNHLIRRQARTNQVIAADTNKKVEKIEKQTNGELNSKIKSAVHEVFSERYKDINAAVVAEAINDLLMAHADPPEREKRYGDD